MDSIYYYLLIWYLIGTIPLTIFLRLEGKITVKELAQILFLGIFGVVTFVIVIIVFINEFFTEYSINDRWNKFINKKLF